MNLIVAVDKEWGIGYKGDLLFNLKEDMKFFRNITKDKIVVMGKNTLLSLPNGKPLKNRINIIITRDKNFQVEGCIVCNSIDELLEKIKDYHSDNVFVIGGGNIYNQLYPYCTKAYITKINTIKPADTFIHNFDEDINWEEIQQSFVHEDNGVNFTFNVYKKIN